MVLFFIPNPFFSRNTITCMLICRRCARTWQATGNHDFELSPLEINRSRTLFPSLAINPLRFQAFTHSRSSMKTDLLWNQAITHSRGKWGEGGCSSPVRTGHMPDGRGRPAQRVCPSRVRVCDEGRDGKEPARRRRYERAGSHAPKSRIFRNH